jgi:hypothetical protein
VRRYSCVPFMAVSMGNEACNVFLGGQNKSDSTIYKYLSNLHHNPNDMGLLCSLISRETNTREIFVPDEMDLPLIEVSAALEAACGDIKFLVCSVTCHDATTISHLLTCCSIL